MSSNNADLLAADSARVYANAIGSALLSDMPDDKKAGVVADAQKILDDLNKIKKSNAETYAMMMIVCEAIFRSFHDSMAEHNQSVTH